MKISDWKSKVQALFRPAQPDRAATAIGPRAAFAHGERKPVEIAINGTGERFVHVPSLEAAAESRGVPTESHRDVLERNAAELLEHWDGRSVRDIDTEIFYDYPHLETHSALQDSVPVLARAELWLPGPHDPAYRSSITVLAIDQSGEALVKQYVVDDVRNADGCSYSVMSTDLAAETLREHGAAADLKLDIADAQRDGPLPVQPAAIGATYRGPILSIQGDSAYQDVGGGTAIEHKLGALVVTTPQRYVGQEVEISYPCGKVGLVRQVDGMAKATTALEKAGAENNSAALER